MSHLETIFNTVHSYPPPAEQTHAECTNLNERFWQQPVLLWGGPRAARSASWKPVGDLTVLWRELCRWGRIMGVAAGWQWCQGDVPTSEQLQSISPDLLRRTEVWSTERKKTPSSCSCLCRISSLTQDEGRIDELWVAHRFSIYICILTHTSLNNNSTSRCSFHIAHGQPLHGSVISEDESLLLKK